MKDMDILYPEGVFTTEEEREFDSFLLNYITEIAAKQGSPKIQLMLEEVMEAWEDHKG